MEEEADIVNNEEGSRGLWTYLDTIHDTLGLLLNDQDKCNNDNNHDDNDDQMMIVDENMEQEKRRRPVSEVEYIDEIAKRLFLACHTHRLSRGVETLPPFDIYPNSYDVLDEPEEEDEEDDDDGEIVRRPRLPRPRPYQLRRVDYVRRICMALGPVSMDVAVRIVTTNHNSQSSFHALLVLFSIWLPIAPHLTPMVTDLFLQETFTIFPLDPYHTDSSILVLEAAWKICHHYCRKCLQYSNVIRFWDWSPIFGYLGTVVKKGDVMDVDGGEHDQFLTSYENYSIKRKAAWYASRVAGYILNLAPGAKADFFQKYDLQHDGVAFVRFEWDIHQEELEYELLWMEGKTKLFNGKKPIPIPEPNIIRRVIPLHANLVAIDDILVFWKQQAPNPAMESATTALVHTPTTVSNLSLLATALGSHLPILVCGPAGIGKSAMIRELARILSNEEILEIHVDETTDTKSLLGSYTVTDIPGEFAWKPGALTHAIQTGRWVILENVGGISYEIQASLVNLFKSRQITVNGRTEICHANFRLWGTYTTLPNMATDTKNYNRKKGLLHPDAWTQIHVDPLPASELQDIAVRKFRKLPESVTQAVLNISRSVRQLLQVLSRISKLGLEGDFVTEHQRLNCLLECFDVIAGALPDPTARRDAVRKMADIWGVTIDLAVSHVFTRCPQVRTHETFTEIGRTQIPIISSSSFSRNSSCFVQTSHVLRLMETIAVCIRENEPTLLVGETGTGKTSILQHLANFAGRELIVQNLSLQTDSADLLGGYRPLEMKNVARRLYQDFVDLFTATFSRKQNAQFLQFTSDALQKENWKSLSQCFCRAAKLGLAKLNERKLDNSKMARRKWEDFNDASKRFEQQRLACDTGLAFVFTEGALVDAIRSGKWVLLDEINLASSETLQRLCGLLDDSSSSLTLTERGDVVAIQRHPSFRLFAAMNPATDAGKKDLTEVIRSRFTEIFVDELVDPIELRQVSASYVASVLPASARPPEHTDLVVSVVDLYLHCRQLAEKVLVDGNGQKPRYTVRTLSRALTAAKTIALEQNISLSRSVYEGFQLAFQGPLDQTSTKAINKIIDKYIGKDIDKNLIDHPGRRPRGSIGKEYTLIKPFWIKTGKLDTVDWSEVEFSEAGRPRFILTPSTAINLRRLTRAIASGPWPILLEGPTSAGKTTLVEYVAARCGHNVVRINNHEHTDIQEYTGGFAADSKGKLSFQDGILVRALRLGYWVILDELNLAPSEVLEALNRLLDDNRELYLAEINEIVKPHPDFRLFATQNPSGAYGGRKPLSRAFRNRFVEIHVDDIPSPEMATILERRCGCAPSHSQILVNVMDALRRRRSKSGVFMGKDGLITPRDLLRWAQRGASSKVELAQEGFMLLAERLRTFEEKECVKEEIESHFKTRLSIEDVYYGPNSEARQILTSINLDEHNEEAQRFLSSVAATRSLQRLLTLVMRCIRNKEPVLLVGETGCGKTVSVQLLSFILKLPLHIINCHQTTESSDLIGGLRPVRGRTALAAEMFHSFVKLVKLWPDRDKMQEMKLPSAVENYTLNKGSLLEISEDVVNEMARVTQDLCEAVVNNSKTASSERDTKRQKVENEELQKDESNNDEYISYLIDHVLQTYRRYNALFEWSDGPLVRAMKAGEMILLDEISLADDAVLERLNSVLEPSRTIVLAEKGCSSSEDSQLVTAHDSFQLFATMNPGGDFGKRELSPALRSRFTEIWVPAVTDMLDIDLALEALMSKSILADSTIVIKKMMLDYVQWFNQELCQDPVSALAEHTLSLRDILSWARFVIAARQANDSFNNFELYVHGARLMHLDGLGLGTGLSSDVVRATKRRSESFLRAQVSGKEISLFEDKPVEIKSCGNLFGAEPFWITKGKYAVRSQSFHFHAPTVALNAMRILRAMQLRKPILLEGAPGVGKTSLVGALAAASGHNLVRINLSEQTDITDLLGSDLPVPDGSDSESVKTSFRWFDGVLLSAIKNGDWVLLDELNLASQSVLEGLNSCLDHRASVYIPELGCSFNCPASFRIFAAQNPLAQGGGRKGLPKSFLNRFTKVFVDTLSVPDLELIVSSRFPTLEVSMSLVDFNNKMHVQVVNEGKFGHLGAPWEFNLRDVFRWCELLSSKSSTDIQPDSHRTCRFARDLYFQRFRTEDDRQKALTIYSNVFGEVLETQLQEFYVSQSEVRFGDVGLFRKKGIGSGYIDLGFNEAFVPLSLLEPYEAVSRCAALGWPCLLVGPSASGKTTLIRSLATLTNSRLKEIALSSSSDVSELVGCFEQVDRVDQIREALIDIHKLVSFFILYSDEHKQVQTLSTHFLNLQQLIGNVNEFSDRGLDCAIKILTFVEESYSGSEILCSKMFTEVSRKIRRLHDQKYNEERKEAHFSWKDGPLVEAMIEGHWLHLQNVNLCSSSVLDRLNPIMEPGGRLLLAECGSDDDMESGHREIRCHPDFRIFLSMNAEHGEVSRAMRNRCVEISLLEKARDDQVAFLDQLGELSLRGGIRSSALASSVLCVNSTHSQQDAPNYSQINFMASINATLRSRCAPFEALKHCLFRMFHKCSSSDQCSKVFRVAQGKSETDGSPCFWTPTVQENWAISPYRSRRMWAAQPLRNFIKFGNSQPQFQSVIQEIFSTQRTGQLGSSAHSRYLEFDPLTANIEFDVTEYRDHLICFYLVNVPENCLEYTSLNESSLIMCQSQDTSRKSLRFGGKSLLRFPCPERILPAFRQFLYCRALQSLKEQLWKNKLEREKNAITTESISFLEASYYINTGILDNKLVRNSLTPLLYTFFLKFDYWVDFTISEILKNARLYKADVLKTLAELFEHKNMLWILLQEYRFPLHTEKSFIVHDASEFVVGWSMFCKSHRDFTSRYLKYFPDKVMIEQQDVKMMIESIECCILNSNEGGCGSFPSLMRFLTVPLVPRRINHWQTLKSLRRLCVLSCISRDMFLDENFVPLDLHKLLLLGHPVLFAKNKTKHELLGALSTILLTSARKIDAEILGNSDHSTMFHSRFSQVRDVFVKDLHLMGLNTISIDNAKLMGIDELEKLCMSPDFLQEYKRIGVDLLGTVSSIQVAPCAEWWCEREELCLIRKICQTLLRHQGNEFWESINELRGKLRRFLDVGVTSTQWNVADLVPYNILLWSLEAGDSRSSGTRHLVQSLMPKMFSNVAKRTWSNSSSLFHRISFSLAMPTTLASSLDLSEGETENPQKQRPSVQEMKEHIPTKLTFSMIGDVFRLGIPQGRRSVFATVENYKVRELQLGMLVEILGRVNDRNFSHSFPDEITFLLTEILECAFNVVPGDLLNNLLRAAKDPEFTPPLDFDSEEALNCVYLDLFRQLLVPLFDCLKQLHHRDTESSKWYQNVALAQIYLGLLRFHLLKPDSPLDPGQEPIAKIAILHHKIQKNFVQLAAVRLTNGYQAGNFSPVNKETLQLLEEGKQFLQEKLSLQTQVIERDCQSFSFSDLFTEARESSSSCLSVSSVLRLVRLFTESVSEAKETDLLHAESWQSTTAIFCDRLLENYSDFDDVVLPLVGAVGFIKDGLRRLATLHASQSGSSSPRAYSFLVFPMTCPHSRLIQEIQFFNSVRCSSRQRLQCKRAAGIAVLSRMLMRQKLTGMHADILFLWKTVQSQIIGEMDTQDPVSESGQKVDETEKEFRDQFPDHRAEFRVLSEEQNGRDESFMDETADYLSQSPHDDCYMEMIALFHEKFFSRSRAQVIDDALRVKMFRLSFDAAYQIYRHIDCKAFPSNADLDSLTTSHIFALAMASPSSNNPMASKFLHTVDSPYDFHRDPNPSEARLVTDVLWRLIARVSQLLDAFPGNEILSVLAAVAHQVMKLDLLCTPLGKLLSGLEVLLRHAQDWEQHASQRVLLGDSLKDVANVVRRWRKIELESWRELLCLRERKHAKRATIFWTSLCKMLSNAHDLMIRDDGRDGSKSMSPCWVWKGIVKVGERLSYIVDDTSKDLLEIMKTLDTFCLTSTIGEFRSRLRILEAFSNQLMEESKHAVSKQGMKYLPQCVRSLLAYYNQFLPLVDNQLKDLRRPFEKRLEQEVKLAKWDDQTYFAMAESSERNHRTLMRVLREYDQVLDVSVMTLFESELSRGVCLNNDGGALSAIPSDSSLFTFQIDDRVSQASKPESTAKASFGWTWTDASRIGMKMNDYSSNIERYVRKIVTFRQKEKGSYSRLGKSIADEICATIFERIQSLRSEKTTRPMKERALVDLFRELKKQGYCATKWSVPHQVRSMDSLLHLPFPNFTNGRIEKQFASALASSEHYYQRCLAESSQFRKETALIANAHMTLRQLDMMLGFCDHGSLLLAQQRCILASVLECRERLDELISSIMECDKNSLNLSNTQGRSRVSKFSTSFLQSLESIQQLRLLLSATAHLLSEDKSQWCNNAVMKLEHFLSSVKSVSFSNSPILSCSEINDVENAKKSLQDALVIICELKEGALAFQCFAPDAFEESLSLINEAINYGNQCVKEPLKLNANANDTVNTCIESSSHAVKTALLTVQRFMKKIEIRDDRDTLIWELHHLASSNLAAADLRVLISSLESLIEQLKSLGDMNENAELCLSLAKDVGMLVREGVEIIDEELKDFVAFFRSTSKLQYVLVRIFRVLSAQGYCSAQTNESKDGDGEDNAIPTSMNSENGTGMGEGEGGRDVTEEIESEEQLLGLKNEKNEESKDLDRPDSKKLGKEEADKGMEMEGDFEGDLFDLPEDDNQNDAEDEKDEVDREMGEDGSPTDNVIDEKLWDENDGDGDEKGEEDEKFEKNSSVKGAGTTDEMITQEGTEEDTNNDGHGINEEENDLSVKSGEHDAINNDHADKYEDNQGANVRDESLDNQNFDEQLELGFDDMSIENDGTDGSEELHSNDELSRGSNDQELDQNLDEHFATSDHEEAEEVQSVTETNFTHGTAESPEDKSVEDDNDDNKARAGLPPEPNPREGLGLKDKNGNDIVADHVEDEMNNGGYSMLEEEHVDQDGNDSQPTESADNGGSQDNSGQNQAQIANAGSVAQEHGTVPNPLKCPGDASKFWHRKLNMVERELESEQVSESLHNDSNSDNQRNDKGAFEYSDDNHQSTSQVLGEVDEENAIYPVDEAFDEEHAKNEEKHHPSNEEGKNNHTDMKTSSARKVATETNKIETDPETRVSETDVALGTDKTDSDDDEVKSELLENDTDDGKIENRVVSDPSQLRGSESDASLGRHRIITEERLAVLSMTEINEAQRRWSLIQNETYSLSRRLCEKLRLVLEPLVASKLRGDYRTGKRINMKRVIGYIASGYRKDKIWLRRTKPAKRNYRVLLAVDDSESMLRSGAGDMALKAMTTLAVGMSQLEVGEVGIASFGESMNLVQPFNQVFSSQNGINVVQNFHFKQQRTRTALCLESVLMALNECENNAKSMQLVFMISDGRIERDSRSEIRRLIREMIEQNILLVLIIVEGSENKKDSIVHMREVTFERGKPKVKQFMEDYPFPYYIVLSDMHSLPEVLGDALRQWFEMLTRLQANGVA